MKGEPYTTGEAAEILGVSQRMVVKLHDAGKLRGFKHPGPRHHRKIFAKDLTDFLRIEGNLSNPVYVNHMRTIWKEYGFHPYIPQPA